MVVNVYLYPVPAITGAPGDVFLYDPTTSAVRPGDDRYPTPPGHYLPVAPRGPWRKEEHQRQPLEVVAHSLMDDLVERYGLAHGREVYFAMERELKGPFAPGNKYDATLRPAQKVEVAAPLVRVEPIPEARRN